jgi:hypothetical protein
MSEPNNPHASHGMSSVLLALALLAAASACSAGKSGDAPAVATSLISAAPTVAAGAVSTEDLDACNLLTDAEIAALIGTNGGGKGSGGSCSWENQDNYHSVSVDIGQSGTAADGKLPTPLPGAKVAAGPDGIRFSSGNIAEFLIGDRACQVQLVTSVTDEKDRPSAVKLIALIRSRVSA